MERRTKFLLGCLGVLAAALITVGGGGVWLFQYVSYRDELDLLERQLLDADRRFKEDRATAARLPDFRREWERRELVQKEALAAVPRSLDVPAFMSDLTDWAKRSNVAIVSHRVEQKRREIYEEAEITLALEGTKDDLDDLRDRRGELTRLIRWAQAEPKLSIFALPDFSSSNHPCSRDFESDVWLPPYPKRIALAYAKLQTACDELSRLKAIDAQIQLFKDMVADLERRTRVIEALKPP